MVSTVDTVPSIHVDESAISMTKVHEVATDLTVCRLRSGAFTLTLRDGERRVIFDLSADELRALAAHLMEFVG